MSKWSQVPLVIGLAVGCLAIWSGAAPVGLNGDLVTGSWVELYRFDGKYIGCTGSTCQTGMNGKAVTLYCSQGYPYTCYGGAFIGVEYQGNGHTVWSQWDGESPCSYDGGNETLRNFCFAISVNPDSFDTPDEQNRQAEVETPTPGSTSPPPLANPKKPEMRR
jgi:hypothetical protein